MTSVAQLHPQSADNSSWEKAAACKVADGDMTAVFFSDQLGDITKAKNICSDCPVMANCLESALGREEQWGVWGGQLFMSGRIVQQKRGRGRPRKTPRPEDTLPTVPFPESLAHLQSA